LSLRQKHLWLRLEAPSLHRLLAAQLWVPQRATTSACVHSGCIGNSSRCRTASIWLTGVLDSSVPSLGAAKPFFGGCCSQPGVHLSPLSTSLASYPAVRDSDSTVRDYAVWQCFEFSVDSFTQANQYSLSSVVLLGIDHPHHPAVHCSELRARAHYLFDASHNFCHRPTKLRPAAQLLDITISNSWETCRRLGIAAGASLNSKRAPRERRHNWTQICTTTSAAPGAMHVPRIEQRGPYLPASPPVAAACCGTRPTSITGSALPKLQTASRCRSGFHATP